MSPLVAIAAVFSALGLTMGLWAGASAALLLRAGVGPGAFGVALTAYTAIYIAALSGGGALAERFGVGRVLVVAAPTMGALTALLLDAQSAPMLFGAMLAQAFAAGLVDLAMNAEGARVERELGRPILARLHAAASSGIAVGAIAGSLIAASGAPWLNGAMAFLGLAAATLALRRALDLGAPVRVASARPRGVVFAPGLILLGLVVGAAIAAENAATLWSSLLLRQEAPRLAAVSGLGAAFFAACQAALRFNADAIRARFDDRGVMVASLFVVALGYLVVAADGGFALSVAGFALVGAGSGAVVPCGFALAARHPGVAGAVGLSSAMLFTTLTRMPAPYVTGYIADHYSLSRAFGAFAIFLLLAAGALAILSARPAARPRLS